MSRVKLSHALSSIYSGRSCRAMGIVDWYTMCSLMMYHPIRCLFTSIPIWHPERPTRYIIHAISEYPSHSIHLHSLLSFILTLFPHNTVVDRPKSISYTMFKSILTFSLISLSVISVSAAPMPMNFRLARRDGGSAYSGVGGEANGGNVNKYNRSVHLFSFLILRFYSSGCEMEREAETIVVLQTWTS